MFLLLRGELLEATIAVYKLIATYSGMLRKPTTVKSISKKWQVASFASHMKAS